MIYNNPIVHLVGCFFMWMCFFYIFSVIYHPNKLYPFVFLEIIALVFNFFTPLYADLFIITIIFLLYQRRSQRLFLFNALLLSIIIKSIFEIIENSLGIFYQNFQLFSSTNLLKPITFIVANFLIEIIITIIFQYSYIHLNLRDIWKVSDSILFSILMSYLYITIFLFVKIINYYKAYTDFLSGTFLFILIQCTFIVIIFLKNSQIQKQNYSRELKLDQLKNLKMYTDQLEHDQIKLRHFENNYKNQIKDLRNMAQDKDFEKIQSSLGYLEDYSNNYFDNVSMQLFKDMNNIVNPYLKSLLISKLTLINQKQIPCHFECQDIVDNVAINIFDLIRLLGISFDNAIEATSQNTHGEIQIAIIQDDKQLSFIINNTTNTKDTLSKMMQDGYSSKVEHSGFGLVNIQNIKKKYPNLFVQYQKKHQWFHLNIQIIKQ